MSNPLTFDEIQPGEHFIFFPSDGDDSGHGGYRGSSRVFQKLEKDDPAGGNAIALGTKMPSDMTPGMLVIRVLI